MRGKWRFFAAGMAILAAAVLGILFFKADEWADNIAGIEKKTVSQEDFGENQSSLTVDGETLEFDGNGIFDPMKGVKAIDCDGKDISYKVAVAYIMERDIEKKTVRYTVYNSAGEKLVAERELELSGYQGPDIAFDAIESVNFEDLEDIVVIMGGNGLLHGDDGFGNDTTECIACSYELSQEGSSAIVTLSLQNVFGDVKLVKFEVAVENMPNSWLD